MDAIGKFLKLPEPDKKQGKIYTADHELAKELCDYFKEKKFGMWLGVIKRFGRQNVFLMWKNLSDYPKPFTGRLLMFQLKKKYGGTIKPKNAVGKILRKTGEDTSSELPPMASDTKRDPA